MSGMHPAAFGGFGAIVIIVGGIVTAWTVVMSVYWCIRPGETDLNHPKRTILRGDR